MERTVRQLQVRHATRNMLNVLEVFWQIGIARPISVLRTKLESCGCVGNATHVMNIGEGDCMQ